MPIKKYNHIFEFGDYFQHRFFKFPDTILRNIHVSSVFRERRILCGNRIGERFSRVAAAGGISHTHEGERLKLEVVARQFPSATHEMRALFEYNAMLRARLTLRGSSAKHQEFPFPDYRSTLCSMTVCGDQIPSLSPHVGQERNATAW